MALFKMFNNIDSKNTTLPNTYTKGYMYYDVKDSIFYIDIDGTGGTAGARQKINAWGAEKSLKDSLNQQIDTTYIKGISISNNKLSYTLGDGTSHTVEGILGAVTGVKGNAETTYRTGQINLTPANIGAATSGHTHTTTIATDSGTSQLTLAFGAKYKLTAGGTSYIFTMPTNPDTNTASAVDNILDGSNSGTAITYAPYTSQQVKLSFDTSTTNPTRTDRLNLNGYLYATKLYSGGKEVLTAHQSLSNYKTKQTAVSSATAETSTATTFVYSVTQNDNGEITVKTRPLPTYNNYTLPKATDGALGGIQTGYSSSGKNYAIKVDANGNAYVNVPWENTHQDISGKANLNSPAFTGTPTAPTAANGTNNTQIATTAFVMNAFTANDAMVFKGVLGTESGMIASLPTAHSQGWTYKVGTAGTYAGQVCEVGDTIYCVTDGTAANNAHWVILQTNVDGTVIGPATSTADHIATFTGTTGKVIKDSGFTIATSVPANAVFTDTKVTSAANHYTPSRDTNADKSASASGATAAWSIDVVKGVTLQTDGKGHVTGVSVTSGKIPGNPNTDRYVNSASFTDDTSNSTTSPVKLTLTRAGSDTATVTASIPKVSASSAGVAPKGASVSSQSQSTKFLREDGTWAAPSYTTNTWRGIQNNLTSDSTTDSLSAAQGKALKALIDGKTSNTGTVTSVAASGSGGITISGSPITTSGTLSVGLNLNTAINGLSEGSSTPVDADYYVSQYVGGGTSTTTYHRRPMSALYNYVKGKLAVTNNTINLSRNTETTIATIAGTPIKIKLPASDNTWRGVQNNLTSDATDQSLSAAQGKALKALIDGKTSNTGTVTSVATGAGLTGGTITGSGTIKANLNSETSLGTLGTTSKLYAVGIDANGKLAVNVPWENSTYSLSGLGGIGSISASGTAPLTLSASKSGTTVTLTGSIAALSTSKAGYVSQAPNDTTKFLRGDATWAQVNEASLAWGGRNFAGSYGCIDAAMVDVLGANRLMFLSPNGITIEYSRDNGSTWIDYGANNSQKRGLFAAGTDFFIGKADSTNKATANGTNYQLRITINTGAAYVYTALNKFVIYVSTNGSQDCNVTIQKALESTPTSYTTVVENIPLSGWSGYNVINVGSITTYGNAPTTQYGRLRFIFKANGGNTSYLGLSVSQIMGFGGVGWTTPSTMAKTGHLYGYDNDLNANFPAKVKASNFEGPLQGNADTATKFASSQSIALTGDVTGSASSQAGWSIATTIGAGKVTNAMLAGSIANGKLANSKVTIAGNDISLGGSLTADTLRTSLGLSNAMHFKGTTTTTMSDGLTTAAVTIGGSSYTPSAGDVVLYRDAEFVWTGSSWERLGRDSSFKTTQSAVSDPSASGTSTTFIKTISQDANGVITPTKASLPTASTSVAGITKLGASGGAATYEHTHGLSIAADSGTSSISLTANTKYKLTAGGSTYIFTTPPDNNTWRGIQNNLTSNSTTDSLSAAQGKALKALIDGKTSNTGTVTSVATGVGLTGGTITGSGTIKAKLRSETALTNNSAAATETSGRVYPVAIDKSGYLAVNVPWTNVNNSYLTSHQTVSNKGATLAWGTSTTIATIGSTNINVSLPANPNSDTKNTAGSTDTSSKIFLIGATSQAANPQTYSDNQVYATNGQLDANKIRIAEQVSLVFNSTTQALDFVFA